MIARMMIAGLLAAGLNLASGVAEAATVPGYTATSEVFFDGAATLDYDPVVLGGSAWDADLLLDLTFSPDLTGGSLTLFDGFGDLILDGSLLATALEVDNDVGDDSFTWLFQLVTGTSPFVLVTFTGDLDGLGWTDFLTEGVLFVDGALKITGAEPVGAAVVPLPAGIVLMGSTLAGFGAFAARRRRT